LNVFISQKSQSKKIEFRSHKGFAQHKDNCGCNLSYVLKPNWMLDGVETLDCFPILEILQQKGSSKVDSIIFQPLCLHSTRHWCHTTIEYTCTTFVKAKS